MRKVLAAGAVGLALFAGMAAPEVASAATPHTTITASSSPPRILLGGRCTTGVVRVNTSAVYLYEYADTSSRPLFVANRGTYLGCGDIFTSTAAYRLCGAARPANGYISVDGDRDGYLDSWVPSTCVTDA